MKREDLIREFKGIVDAGEGDKLELIDFVANHGKRIVALMIIADAYLNQPEDEGDDS